MCFRPTVFYHETDEYLGVHCARVRAHGGACTCHRSKCIRRRVRRRKLSSGQVRHRESARRPAQNRQCMHEGCPREDGYPNLVDPPPEHSLSGATTTRESCMLRKEAVTRGVPIRRSVPYGLLKAFQVERAPKAVANPPADPRCPRKVATQIWSTRPLSDH